jgi:hypothetical protein
LNLPEFGFKETNAIVETGTKASVDILERKSGCKYYRDGEFCGTRMRLQGIAVLC